MPIMNEDTRIILGSVAFTLLLVVCVVIAILSHNAYEKREMERVGEKLYRQTMLRRQKEREAADSELFDKVEEYHRDFDDAS